MRRIANVAIGAVFLSALACDAGSSTDENAAAAGTAGDGGSTSTGGGNASGGASATGGGAGATTSGGSVSAAGTTSGGGSAGSSAGGASSGSGGGGSSGTAAGEFTLRFRDDFDSFDSTRWQAMTHSWDTNLALFSADSVSIEDGVLVTRLLPAPEGTVDSGNVPKQFLGAEVRSVATLTYGRVTARAKLARGSAVVSSLVTIYTPWPADDWNELDIECLGEDPSFIQFNAMVYTGPPTTPPVTTSVQPTQSPQKQRLPFDPSADFHVYTIEWTPAGARFSIDDQLWHTWTEHADLMKLPQNVLLTIWASSSAAWAGPVTEATAQAAASYDWIELYDYAAP